MAITVNPASVSGVMANQTFGPVTVSATGGTSPYTFSISAGSLPTGIVLTPITASTATLFGAPTTPGTYSFTVRATDALTAFGVRAYVLVVAAAPAGVTTTSVVSLDQVYGLCTAILNAATTTYGTIDDPLRMDDEIKDAIKAADREVAQAIIDTAGHRHRADYAVLQDVTSAFSSGGSGLIAYPIYAVQIDGKPGKYVPADTLRTLAGLSTMGHPPVSTNIGYYSVEDQMLAAIYATSVKVQIIKYTEPMGDMLASPAEYLMALVAGALAILFPKEGAFVEAATHFAGLFAKCLELIKTGATVTFATPAFVIGRSS